MMAADPAAAGEPDAPMEKLSSNVMNYLVWRYLQESGYGKTAKQLQFQWMGRDYSPEQLPFAHKVKKSALIHMAQDGLMLDQLQAEVKKMDRQYVFGPDHGRKYSIPAEEPREKKSRVRSLSRVPSTTVDRELHNGSPADAHAPSRRPKGKRKSGGGAEKRVNGDAMDIDSGAASNAPGGATTTTATEAESPQPPVEELISTLEIGESKGTITEKPRDLTEGTCFVGLEPGLVLEQVTWSPHNRTALVTAGKNHMRVFKITANDVPESNTYTRGTNVAVPSQDYEVQAFCWTEKGSGAFTTLEKQQNEHGDEMMQYRMFGFTDYGQKVNLVDATAGWVLALKYNADAELLLSLSWGEQSHIKIWAYSETIYENSKRRVEPRYELKWAKTMPWMLYAVEWISATQFMVCGQNSLNIYEVGDELLVTTSLVTDHVWVRMEYDPTYEMAAILDQELQTLGVVHVHGGELNLQTQRLDFKVTDLAFQPVHTKPADTTTSSTRILAVASDMGQVYLYNVLPSSASSSSSSTNNISVVRKLEMGFDSIPQVLSFSHDGFLLAAAGYDTLNIWKTDVRESGDQPCAVWRIPHGVDERWKSEVASAGAGAGGANVNGIGNGNGEGVDDEDEDEDDAFVHKLGWDADGKRLAFGMNGQVAVIRL